ncbi:MAG: RelA/SpoT domain-containing protein [Sarcina sp.]
MCDELMVMNVLEKYPHVMEIIKEENININNLDEIYRDYTKNREAHENQIEFIANILRSNKNVHSVKSRIKNADRLIEKIIRKTRDRKNKYGEEFEFNVSNYRDEINDMIGVRVIHIFKEEWEAIHDFINKTWRVIEITANVRDGDNTKRFNELGIEVRSRTSGYRSVHYLVELNFTLDSPIIAEIQVRTIFEEGYGEIDHRLRYSHNEIPEILKDNILVFNRLIGSVDEMSSLISHLSTELLEKNAEIEKLKALLKK